MSYRRRRFMVLGGLLATVCLVLLLASAERRVMLLARNTLWLGAATCALSLPLGTWLAVLLSRTDVPLRRTLWLLVLTLLFVPLYLQAAAWGAGFGKLGWYSLSGTSLTAPLLSGWGAAVWIHGLWSVPWVTLMVAAVLHTGEAELEEAALLDASAWRVFCRVTLRRARPGLWVAGIWVFLVTAAEMTVTDLYQIRTLAEELYSGLALAVSDETTFGAATALTVTGLLVGVALMAVDTLVIAAAHVPRHGPFRFRLGRWRLPLLGLLVAFAAIWVGVPVGSLVYQAGSVVRQVDGGPVRGWSFQEFCQLLLPLPGTYCDSALWQFADVFGWTLLIGCCAASLSLTLAVLLAWQARRGDWHVLPAAMAAALGLAVMGPLVGLAISGALSLWDVGLLVWLRDRTIAAPVLAATIRALPLPVLICFVAFRTLPRDTLDAALLDGAGRVARIWWLGVRQRWPALLVAWLAAFAVAGGELSATIMVNPPGMTTVPIRVFGLLHAGVRHQVAAISLTGLLAVLLIAALITCLTPRLWSVRTTEISARMR